MDADPRHADIIVKHLDLQESTPLAARTEGINPKHLTEDDVKKLSNEDASSDRALTARGNYLSIDRSACRHAECRNHDI